MLTWTFIATNFHSFLRTILQSAFIITRYSIIWYCIQHNNGNIQTKFIPKRQFIYHPRASCGMSVVMYSIENCGEKSKVLGIKRFLWYLIFAARSNILYPTTYLCYMITSSNRNTFHVTGPLCGDFTGHRWISLTKVSDAELWCFLWSAPWINSYVSNHEAGDLRRNLPHYDVIVMRN